MSYRIAITNLKGGVGKTTICFNLAGALAEKGKKVLLVDMDHQGNLSSMFIPNIYDLRHTIADVLVNDDEALFKDVLHRTSFDNIDVIPANLTLSDIDTMLASDGDAQYFLFDELEEMENDPYDFILIDCPPNLGLATRMSLIAAHGFIVPIECQKWAPIGSQRLMSVVMKIRRRANPDLEILGYVISKFDTRRKINQDYLGQFQNAYKEQLFKTIIGDYVQYIESVTRHEPITTYASKSKQANTFREFANELINHERVLSHGAR